MKFFQKTWVAWLCTAAMIGAAVVIGLNKESAAVPEPGEVGLDSSLSTAQFADYIWDQAGVLSDSQERDICLYNANWVQRYDSLIALAVVDGVSGDIGDYAYSLGEEIELASSDGILVIDVKNTNGYLAVGPDYPMTDQQVTNYMDQSLYEVCGGGRVRRRGAQPLCRCQPILCGQLRPGLSGQRQSLWRRPEDRGAGNDAGHSSGHRAGGGHLD